MRLNQAYPFAYRCPHVNDASERFDHPSVIYVNTSGQHHTTVRFWIGSYDNSIVKTMVSLCRYCLH